MFIIYGQLCPVNGRMEIYMQSLFFIKNILDLVVLYCPQRNKDFNGDVKRSDNFIRLYNKQRNANY